MKTVVICKSNTGFTRQYAQWIAEELSADIFDVSKITANALVNYDTIIYGGSLHAVGIIGVKFIKQNLEKLKGKKVVVFATGATPAREEAIVEVRDKNLTPEEQKCIKFFYMRGGFDYSKLDPFNKILMTMLKWKLKMKKDLTPDEKGMLAAYDKPIDFTRKSNIDNIIAYVNS